MTQATIIPSAEQAAAQQHLEKRALKGTSYVVLSYGLSSSLRLVSSVVLTRLFAPSYFGLMALMTTILVGLNLLTHVGLNDVVIQNARGEDPVFLKTTWTLQVIRGVILWIAAFAVAWPAAVFYHERLLLIVLPIFGFTCVISGFSSSSLLLLSRQMAVGRLSFLELLAQFVQFAVTAVWALIHRDIWALVGGRIVSELVRTLVSFWIGPRHNVGFAWDRETVRAVVHLGRWILLSTGLTFFAMQSDRLILGKLVSWRLLGIYGIAYSLSDIPRQVIAAFTMRVGYPFIARFSDRPRPDLRAILLKYRGRVLAVGALLLGFLIVSSDQVILHIYDNRYHQAAWMVVILCCGLWHTLMADTLSPVLLSVQRAHYQTFAMGAYCATLFISLPLGYHYFGMVGAVIAVAASDLPVYVINTIGMIREGLSVLRQDVKLTLLMASIVSVGLLLRYAIGIPSPFHLIP